MTEAHVQISIKPNTVMQLLKDFLLNAGTLYLEMGGPTSRLESKLIQVASSHGFKLEVFATPSAVFVSLVGHDNKELTASGLRRTCERSINLYALREVDAIIDRVESDKMSFAGGMNALDELLSQKPIYTSSVMLAACLLMGTSGSLLQGGLLIPALLSGVLTAFMSLVIKPFFKKRGFTGVFYVFGSVFVISVMSLLFEVLLGFPASLIWIGPLLMLVPGLSITTAVSELADHNFVSGMVKLTKSILVLLAMATPIFLAHDLFAFFASNTEAFSNFKFSPAKISEVPFWFQMLMSLTLILTFGLLFQVPRRDLFWSSICGLSGWLVFFPNKEGAFVLLACFVAAVVVGFLSLLFGRWLKVPSQIYSVPGIIAMVPGMLALSSFNYDAPNGFSDQSLLYKVALLAGALVFGLFTSRIFFKQNDWS